LLAANRADIFWQAHKEAEEGNDIYSAEFKDLFEKMMALNPNHRPKLEEILAHPWMQGEFATEAQILTEFKRRKDIVDDEAKNEREEKRAQRTQEAGARVRRAVNLNKKEAELEETELKEMVEQIRE
jgi:serine/threonine protein kinase